MVTVFSLAFKIQDRLYPLNLLLGLLLYSYFAEAQMKDVRVHMIPHHLIYGKINNRDMNNWMQKLHRLIKLGQLGALQLDFDIQKFGDSFLKFFQNPNRLSYTPLLLVEGLKP